MAGSILYHNPRCGKSRGALALLEDRGLDVQVVEYLKTPPTNKELGRILDLLDADPGTLLRTSEPEYKALGRSAGAVLSRSEVIDLIAAHPILLQRPVFIHGDRAVIGRPSERVLELLD